MKDGIEEWRDIIGLEGKYAVSNHGRVKSLPRIAKRICKGKPRPQRVAERILKPGRDSGGYLHVRLDRKSRRIAPLVAEAFIGPKPEGKEVCHNDGDPSNNHFYNLRYGTHEENMQDRVRHAIESGRGFHNNHRKIDDIQKSEIVSLSGIKSKSEIGRMFGVSRTTIINIILESKLKI